MTQSSLLQTSSARQKIEIIGINGIPEIEHGVPLGKLLVFAAHAQGTPIEEGDILVVTQKIVSKWEGRVVELNTVQPSGFAVHIASKSDRDPRLVELVLRESRRVIKVDAGRGILITETKHGFVCANAGIDTSNVPGGDVALLLPKDPDESARRIRESIIGLVSSTIAVVISDTFGRPWREGHVNFAIGLAGINPMKDYRGTFDAVKKLLNVTRIAIADELAAATELVMGKSIGVPAAIVRGYDYECCSGKVDSLLRARHIDLFR